MAKSPAENQASGSETVAAEPLSLNEFCIRLSSSDRRVEMIGAFEHGERNAGRLSDTAQNYAARYQAFINKPA